MMDNVLGIVALKDCLPVAVAAVVDEDAWPNRFVVDGRLYEWLKCVTTCVIQSWADGHNG